MTTYEVGQSITWGLAVTDSAGLPATPGTGPLATVTKPDGTTGVGSVANPTTGNYTASYVATLPGRHRVLWTASGANSAGFPYTDVADVWPTDPRLIISLADARAALNLSGAARADDDELRLYIAATTEVIESLTGPILQATVTDTYYGDGSDSLGLWAYPTEVTGVLVEGVATTAYALGPGGVLWHTSGTWSALSRVVVTYTVGSPTIPPNVILAAREELRFLWQIGQTATRPALGETAGGGTPQFTPMGFAIPNRVVELLAGEVGRHAPVGMG